MAGWAAAAGAAADIFGGWLKGKSSAKAARLQHRRNVDAYKHRFQWQTEDMRKAGLNPMLSAFSGQAGNVAGSSIAESGQMGAAVMGATAKGLAARQATATIQNTDANTAKQEQEQSEPEYRNREKEAQIALASAQAAKVAAETPGAAAKQNAESADRNASAALNSARATNEQAVRTRDRAIGKVYQLPERGMDWLNDQMNRSLDTPRKR